MQYPMTPDLFLSPSEMHEADLGERARWLLGKVCWLINQAHDEGVEEGKRVANHE